MDNYVIFSAARTGSSYLTGAVTKQIQCVEPNVFYGGELFKWHEYFMLGTPGTMAAGGLSALESNPGQLDEYDASQPTGDNLRVALGEGGVIQRESRSTEWAEVAPVSFRRAWEEGQRRLSMLENSYFPWVFKVHPEHLECLDTVRLHSLLERDNTKVILLYRSNLWDWFLSWVAVRHTGVFQQTQRDTDWQKPETAASDLSLDFVKTWYEAAREYVNMALSYRPLAHHVVPYEGFSGDPCRDAGMITGMDIFPEVSHQVKLWSREEKEQMIANLDEVKELFLAYCKLLGYTSGRMHL
jgi:hypothetical protein